MGKRQICYGEGREEILKAATGLFVEKGFNKTTLKDVAEVSGANTALVSYYFGNKDGLRKAVLEQELQCFAKDMKTGNLTEGECARTQLLSMLKNQFAKIRANKAYFSLYVWSIMDGGEYTEEMMTAFWNPVFEMMRENITAIHPNASTQQAEALCFLFGGMLQKYAELFWHYSQHMKTQTAPEQYLFEYERICVQTLFDSLTREEAITPVQ